MAIPTAPPAHSSFSVRFKATCLASRDARFFRPESDNLHHMRSCQSMGGCTVMQDKRIIWKTAGNRASSRVRQSGVLLVLMGDRGEVSMLICRNRNPFHARHLTIYISNDSSGGTGLTERNLSASNPHATHIIGILTTCANRAKKFNSMMIWRTRCSIGS